MKIGEYLRTEREKRGLSLHDVENETKIRAKYLAALESETFDEIPGEVYLLGFLRNYARFLNLNSEEIISHYKSQANKENQEVDSPTISDSGPGRDSKLRHILKLENFKNKTVIFGLLLIFVAGSFIYAMLGLAHKNEKTSPLPSLPQNQQSPQSPPTSTDREGVKVELRGKEVCWLQVKVDGEEEFSGFLNPNETKMFQGEEVICLKLGNAGGVVVFFNDRKISPLGQHGEVVTKEFRLPDRKVTIDDSSWRD